MPLSLPREQPLAGAAGPCATRSRLLLGRSPRRLAACAGWSLVISAVHPSDPPFWQAGGVSSVAQSGEPGPAAVPGQRE